LNVNADEARVLIASVNKDGTPSLKMDEFLDLIYQDNPILNRHVDEEGQKYLEREQVTEESGVIPELHHGVDRNHEVRHMNQLFMILKNRTNEMGANFLKEDQAANGFVNYQRFENVLKKLNINEQIMSDANIKWLYDKFKMDDFKLSYGPMLSSLKGFQYDPDKIYQEQYEQSGNGDDVPKLTRTESPVKKKPASQVLDVQKEQVHQIEKIFQRRQMVNRALQRYFPTKKDFTEFLGKELKVSPAEFDSKTIHHEDLSKIVQSFFGNFEDRLSRRDFDGFLSNYTYNKHGEVKLSEVTNSLYEY
jgi:Ca2+-binding EF-hand superfamily protein